MVGNEVRFFPTCFLFVYHVGFAPTVIMKPLLPNRADLLHVCVNLIVSALLILFEHRFFKNMFLRQQIFLLFVDCS